METLKVSGEKLKVSKCKSAPAARSGSVDYGVRSSSSPSNSRRKVLRAKSEECDLDKSDFEIKTKQPRSRIRGKAFCMIPEPFGLRLKSKEKDEANISFLGISFTRQTPRGRLTALNNLITSLAPGVSCSEKSQKLITKYLNQLKISVCGDKGEKVLNDKDYAGLTETIIKCGFISTIVMKVSLLGFEEKKTAVLVFCNLFRRKVSEYHVVNYIAANPKILFCLLDGYRNQPMALICGTMLRECVRYEKLARVILYSDIFYELFDFLMLTTFEISSDAFLTVKAILMENKKQSLEYLRENYDTFFNHYTKLITCDNYITQVTSMKFLGTLLLDRGFFEVMKKYVDEASNLKRLILLMNSGPSNLQMECFHIFKIFLANPLPSPKIQAIFRRNKERLIQLLQSIDGQKYGDHFCDERDFLVKTLSLMEKPLSDPPTRNGSISTVESTLTDDSNNI